MFHLASLCKPEKSHRIEIKVIETLKKTENFKLIQRKFHRICWSVYVKNVRACAANIFLAMICIICMYQKPPLEMFCKKDILKNFTKSTENPLRRSLKDISVSVSWHSIYFSWFSLYRYCILFLYVYCCVLLLVYGYIF